MNPEEALFEDETQEREFVRWFEQRNIPGKFSYIGSTVDSQLLYDSRGDNHDVTRNPDLEAQSLGAAWSRELHGVKTLVDFGPGDASHSILLMSAVRERYGWLPHRYIAVDFSRTLGRYALGRVSGAWPNIKSTFVQADIERSVEQLMSLDSGSAALYALLGNTIGNVESVLQTLQILHSCVGDGGRLLLSYALHRSERSSDWYVRPYQDESYTFNVAQSLVLVGIPREDIDVQTNYDLSTRRIITTATIRKGATVTLLGRRLTVSSDAVFQCFISRRFQTDEMAAALEISGFKVCDIREAGELGVVSCVA